MFVVKYLDVQKKIVPELLDILNKRYNILTNIYYNQPIGRRMLASQLGMGERIVRNEIDFFKKQGLIEINADGMKVNYEGKQTLDSLKMFIHDLRGLSEMEEFLRENLNLKHVLVVPGDVDENELVLEEIGKSAANYLKSILKDKNIIALTGGTSVKRLVDNMPKLNEYKNLLVLPARGGIGRNVEIQSNTLVAKLAEKLSADYRMLQLIDNVDYAEIYGILNEESIKEVVEKIHKADILIYGIGKADEMARKRGLKEKEILRLKKKGAVGEAFGCYFNDNGKIVFSTPTAGIKGEDAKKIHKLIAIAGGKTKAQAILGVQRYNQKNILITDEGAAKEIINIIKKEHNTTESFN
ncbi:sugar-binding transcriptional regulator [Clostridium botulinum]|uniref:sugar-binding transcriptional regulator n=1 Tax=Clostridium TaxID=1485 RepID=UPI0005D22F96|nr:MULTISPECIES: sugar-binding domain-containing protein [Clostridium]AYF53524.1 Cro/Cl family transcriptional regulator [Clostridium novyi]MBO3440877.1 sugar-binding transcriptional regulator [Clostridium haemolyticum]NFV48206.1 sugar-binding transcriptional regulator [Clostridium botulinum]QPW55795.1 sugar-binding transcriptional regulator [Clostridium botulinum]